jgi:hypothetical protein
VESADRLDGDDIAVRTCPAAHAPCGGHHGEPVFTTISYPPREELGRGGHQRTTRGGDRTDVLVPGVNRIWSASRMTRRRPRYSSVHVRFNER